MSVWSMLYCLGLTSIAVSCRFKENADQESLVIIMQYFHSAKRSMDLTNPGNIQSNSVCTARVQSSS